MTQRITEFTGEFRFLSNFYPSELVWNNIIWLTSEHAYQAAKSHDRAKRLECSRLKTPGQAKRWGKYVELRDDWNHVKYDIMLEIVRAKFTQNPDLKERLLATGDAYLEEGNTWNDRTWGVCPPGSNQGLNYLGKILMTVRDELKCTTRE